MGRYLEVQAIRADFFAVAGGRGAAPSGEGAAPKNREFWNLGSCFSDFFGILGSLDFFGIFGILGFWDFGIFFGERKSAPLSAGDIYKKYKKSTCFRLAARYTESSKREFSLLLYSKKS